MAGKTVRLKRLKSQRKRGRWFHYFRWPNGKETPLIHGVEPRDSRLVAAWAACNAECERTRKPEDAPRQGSVKMGLLAFMETAVFKSWAPVTQKNRAAVYRRLINGQGDRPLATIAADDIRAAFAVKSASGALADLKALRPAFAYLVSVGLMVADPTAEVPRPRLPKSDGYEPWAAEDIQAFRDRWAHGTMQRLAFDLALFSGQRRADLCRMGRQQVRGATLEVKQSKTGSIAYVPMTAELRAALAPAEGRTTFLVTSFGKAFTAAGLGNFFRAAASEAKVDKSLHGLRKAFCIYWAEHGRTVHEIAAMSGHKRLDEIELYTRAADRRRMVAALGSMEGL